MCGSEDKYVVTYTYPAVCDCNVVLWSCYATVMSAMMYLWRHSDVSTLLVFNGTHKAHKAHTHKAQSTQRTKHTKYTTHTHTKHKAHKTLTQSTHKSHTQITHAKHTQSKHKTHKPHKQTTPNCEVWVCYTSVCACFVGHVYFGKGIQKFRAGLVATRRLWRWCRAPDQLQISTMSTCCNFWWRLCGTWYCLTRVYIHQ